MEVVNALSVTVLDMMSIQHAYTALEMRNVLNATALEKTMAIEVLSKRHSSVLKTIICKDCGAELRYAPCDVRAETVSDYSGGKDTYRFIKCPECNAKMYI
jgi:RNase P subunit RPR2